MDMGAVVWGIGRDVAEVGRVFGLAGWILVVATFTLPVASLLAALRGSKLALLPLLGSVALLMAWVMYYALGRWSVEAAALTPFFGSVLVGWLVLSCAMRNDRRPTSSSTASSAASATDTDPTFSLAGWLLSRRP